MPRLITGGYRWNLRYPIFTPWLGRFLICQDRPESRAPGWWFQPTPLKNDGVKVSWDDDIPNGKS